MEAYTYLLLNIVTISYPLYKSLDKRLNYSKNWKFIFPSILISAVFMIIWDILFTRIGIWGFNDKYNLGIELINLPLEEVLFFICIPFACLFIFEVINFYDKKNVWKKAGRKINGILILLITLLLILGYDQMYTLITGIALLILLLMHQFIIKKNEAYLGQFYLSYIVVLVPFIIINGTLTGGWIPEEVVWYNMNETFGIRFISIPLEDFFYCLFMLLLPITIYHALGGTSIQDNRRLSHH